MKERIQSRIKKLEQRIKEANNFINSILDEKFTIHELDNIVQYKANLKHWHCVIRSSEDEIDFLETLLDNMK